MDPDLVRSRVLAARVARLATIAGDGGPRIVPCCFALGGETVYTAVDDLKAKSTLALKRVDRVRRHPQVSLLVDHYEDDWSALWWIRLDGHATVVEPKSADHDRGLTLLEAKYDQYQDQPPPGPMITIGVDRWSAWP